MARIKTSKGYLEYNNQILYFGDKVMDTDKMLENLQILSVYLDKIDINWGPAFGTLIGIVRNDDFLPWNPVFDIYILKEDEERQQHNFSLNLKLFFSNYQKSFFDHFFQWLFLYR